MNKESASRSSNPLMRIVIGVTTTVIGATLLYFLGFDKGPDSFKEKKKATLEAWESLMTYERSFKNAGIRFSCSGNLDDMGRNIINEYDMIIGSIINIKEEKKETADNRIISLIDRRVGTLKDKKNATEQYYRKLSELENSGLPEPELNRSVAALQNDFLNEITSLESRDTIFINEIKTDLKKKYKADFSLPPPLLVTPELLTGNWTLDRDQPLIFKKDLTFEWGSGQDKLTGSWRLDSLTLTLKTTHGDQYDFTITAGGESAFFVKLHPDNSIHILCR